MVVRKHGSLHGVTESYGEEAICGKLTTKLRI